MLIFMCVWILRDGSRRCIFRFLRGLCSRELLVSVWLAIALQCFVCIRKILDCTSGHHVSCLHGLCSRKFLVGFGAGPSLLFAVCLRALCLCTWSHLLSYLHAMCCWELLIGVGTSRLNMLDAMSARALLYRPCSYVFLCLRWMCSR